MDNVALFSTIAQVSATFIGLALLVPAVKALSSRITAKSEIIIAPAKLLRRLLGLVGLLVTIFSVPFLTSLFILWLGIEKVQAPFCVIGVVLAISFLYWFGNTLKHTNLSIDSQILARLLTQLPLILLVILLGLFFLLGILSCLQNLSFFATIPLSQQQCLIFINILLIVIGLLILIRNLSITLEKNIKFKFGDLMPDYADRVKSLLNSIKTAIEEREKMIEKLKGELKKVKLSSGRQEDIKRSIGGHKAKMEMFTIIWKETEKTFQIFLKEGEEGKLTIDKCLKMEDWRKEMEEKHLREFKFDTLRSNRILKEFQESK